MKLVPRKQHRGKRFAASLRVKFMVASTIILVAMSGLIGVTVLRLTREEVFRAYEKQISLTLERLESESTELLRSPTEGLQSMMGLGGTVRPDDGVTLVAFFDVKGELVSYVSGDPAFTQERQAHLREVGKKQKWSMLDAEDEIHFRTREVFARAPHQVRDNPASGAAGGVPDEFHHEARVGTLVLGYNYDPVEAQFASLQQEICTRIALVAGITALLVWIGTGSLVRPIQQLISGTERIARGEYDVLVNVNTGDEIQMLADSFNSMTSQILESRRELDKHNRNLERVVRERTGKLAEAYEDLKSLDKMKDGFLSSISHEFKTPLTSIQAFAEILLTDKDADPETRSEFLGIILRENERMIRLVNDVLDLVRIESGEMPFTFSPTDPRDLMKSALHELEPKRIARGVRVASEADEELPQVHWDRILIQRVFQEIIGNGIRFSPENSTIHVNMWAEGDVIVATIRDHGPGIPAKDLDRVFQKFRQGDEFLTGKPQGTGLGLPICRMIAEHHGGQLCARVPGNGVGSLVELRLPALPPAAVATAIAFEEPEPEPQAS